MDPTLQRFLEQAMEEAQLGLREGGIPIGSVLLLDGHVVGRGHNKRVQRGSPTLHAEMDCLESAGLLDPSDYQRSVLFSTLSPCDMCSGAILLYRIPRVIIGENRNFQGPEDYLRSRGVNVEVLNNAECIALLKSFIENPANRHLWDQDIGGRAGS